MSIYLSICLGWDKVNDLIVTEPNGQTKTIRISTESQQRYAKIYQYFKLLFN